MKLRLYIVSALGGSPTFEHAGPTIRIGRNPAGELSVQGDTVSNNHARIELDPSGAHVWDNNSSNGTFLNDQRIQGHAPITVGDVISLGYTGPKLKVLALDLTPAPTRKKAPVAPPAPAPFAPTEPAPVPAKAGSATRMMLIAHQKKQSHLWIGLGAAAAVILILVFLLLVRHEGQIAKVGTELAHQGTTLGTVQTDLKRIEKHTWDLRERMGATEGKLADLTEADEVLLRQQAATQQQVVRLTAEQEEFLRRQAMLLNALQQAATKPRPTPQRRVETKPHQEPVDPDLSDETWTQPQPAWLQNRGGKVFKVKVLSVTGPGTIGVRQRYINCLTPTAFRLLYVSPGEVLLSDPNDANPRTWEYDMIRYLRTRDNYYEYNATNQRLTPLYAHYVYTPPDESANPQQVPLASFDRVHGPSGSDSTLERHDAFVELASDAGIRAAWQEELPPSARKPKPGEYGSSLQAMVTVYHDGRFGLSLPIQCASIPAERISLIRTYDHVYYFHKDQANYSKDKPTPPYQVRETTPGEKADFWETMEKLGKVMGAVGEFIHGARKLKRAVSGDKGGNGG